MVENSLLRWGKGSFRIQISWFSSFFVFFFCCFYPNFSCKTHFLYSSGVGRPKSCVFLKFSNKWGLGFIVLLSSYQKSPWNHISLKERMNLVWNWLPRTLLMPYYFHINSPKSGENSATSDIKKTKLSWVWGAGEMSSCTDPRGRWNLTRAFSFQFHQSIFKNYNTNWLC